MHLELAHDIIALKVWDFLPEQDKQLRLVKNSLIQRLQDYERGDGSLLGEKELLAWEDALKVINLDVPQQQFIDSSKAAIEKRREVKKQQEQRELHLAQENLAIERRARKRQRYFSIGLGVLTLAAIGLSYWAYQNQLLAKQKQAEAELVAEEMGKSMQNLAQKAGSESIALIKVAEAEYDYQSAYTYASDLKTTLSNNEARIAEFAASNNTIVSDFKASIDGLKSSSENYLKRYQPIVDSGKAGEVKKMMQQLDAILKNNNFEKALNYLRSVKAMNIPFLAETLTEKERQIKQAAYNHYFSLAKNGFTNNESPRAKIINPFTWIETAENYLGTRTTASNNLRQSICAHTIVTKETFLPGIISVKEKCQ